VTHDGRALGRGPRGLLPDGRRSFGDAIRVREYAGRARPEAEGRTDGSVLSTSMLLSIVTSDLKPNVPVPSNIVMFLKLLQHWSEELTYGARLTSIGESLGVRTLFTRERIGPVS
jgi:hypothetical protein